MYKPLDDHNLDLLTDKLMEDDGELAMIDLLNDLRLGEGSVWEFAREILRRAEEIRAKGSDQDSKQ